MTAVQGRFEVSLIANFRMKRRVSPAPHNQTGGALRRHLNHFEGAWEALFDGTWEVLWPAACEGDWAGVWVAVFEGAWAGACEPPREGAWAGVWFEPGDTFGDCAMLEILW